MWKRVTAWQNYSISRCTWKSTKKLFFTSWTYSPHHVWLQIIPQGLQSCLGQEPNRREWVWPQTTPQGRPIPSTNQLNKLEVQHNTGQEKGNKHGTVLCITPNHISKTGHYTQKIGLCNQK